MAIDKTQSANPEALGLLVCRSAVAIASHGFSLIPHCKLIARVVCLTYRSLKIRVGYLIYNTTTLCNRFVLKEGPPTGWE